jgi:choline kinase
VIPVILAAGISSRLRPLTNETPKCLLRVGNTPILQRILDSLYRNHFRTCVIVTGFCKEKIQDFVKGLSLPLSVEFAENPLFASTGNNYSLWTAHPFVHGDGMLLLDADILFDNHILPLLINSPHPNALIIRKANHLGAEEIKVEVDERDKVLCIGKHVRPDVAAGESIGIEKFDVASAARLFEILDRRKERNEFYEASFQEMIDDGVSIHAVDSGGFPCIEIDTMEDLAAADELAQTLP